MKEPDIHFLEETFGKDKFKQDFQKFFPDGKVGNPPLGVLKISDYEMAPEVLRICSERKIKVFTSYNRFFDPSLDYCSGIILDFSELKSIDKFDTKNLIAHIGRAVTFEELLPVARKENVVLFLPFYTPTLSAAEAYLMRLPVKESARYSDFNVSNLYIALPEGKIHRTGEHAISESAGDCRDDPGPNISRWYFGSSDLMGVMVRASVYLYPAWEKRCATLWKVKDLKSTGEILRNLPRHELTVECFTGDTLTIESLTGIKGIPENTLITGFAGREKLVAYNQKRVREFMKKYEAEEVGEKDGVEWVESFIKPSGNPAVVYGSFPSFPEKAKELKSLLKGESGKDLRYVISSYSRGGSFVATLWVEGEWRNILRDKITALQWAYPGLPSFNLKRFFTEETAGFFKKVISITDRERILNPHSVDL